MKKKLLTTLGVFAIGTVIFMLALPTILHSAGLHPDYAGESYELPGKKALIICTSHRVLNEPGEDGGKPTGVFGSELTVPYYDFLDAGMQVDVASIQGGEIPIDPQSFLYMIRTPEDERFQQDPAFQAKVKNSMRIDDIDFAQYDAIFMAGGWGAAYDLGFSEVLGQKISDAYYAESPIIGSVCHGALGLIQAKDREGNPLISGRKISGVTDKQIQELGIDMTPQHPETELRKAGVVFESASKFRDMLATHVSVDDEQRFVTGQNQNAAHETAHKMMALIANRSE